VKVCLIHNFYQQPGGEDRVFYSEKALLENRGHQVFEFTRHNDEIRQYNPLQKIALIGKTIRNKAVRQELLEAVQAQQPEVLHFHNTFPLISPAAYDVGKALQIPVIQTVHNYRFFCAKGLFYRDNRVCEDCFGKRFPLPAIVHACYRDSRLQTFAVAAMQAYHQQQDTWQKQVDAFIALTEFGKEKLLQAGFPAEKVFVKPNFIYPDPGESIEKREGALFVGRLSREKGAETLLKAWEHLKTIPLNIAGDGPERENLQQFVQRNRIKSVIFLGGLSREEVFESMKKTKFLLFPSEWYEGLPMIIAEAYACGIPVIASRLGAMAEIVQEGKTGLLFTPGNAADLAAKVQWAGEHREEMGEMGKNARKEYEEKYTAEGNYEMLMAVYEKAREVKSKK
jgi:glycosyltransferase involved in cell wall biosynthesis